MNDVLHITHANDWQAALNEGMYRTPTLAKEGFIHCSTEIQVLRVADAFYRGQNDLVILVVDASRLSAPLKFEPPINPQTGQPETGVTDLFPHVYGPINLDAVVKVVDFPANDDGLFTLPPI